MKDMQYFIHFAQLLFEIMVIAFLGQESKHILHFLHFNISASGTFFMIYPFINKHVIDSDNFFHINSNVQPETSITGFPFLHLLRIQTASTIPA